MLLQALSRLAEQESLIGDPDFEMKPVSWAIVLTPEGRLVQIADMRANINEGTKRKPKYVGKPMSVPRQPIRTSGDLAFFLVDKSEYTLGYDPDGKREPDKLAVRLALFREQVEACADATRDPGTAAVARFLRAIEDSTAAIQSAFGQSPWATNELFAFRVGLSEPVHLSEAVRAWWKEVRNSGHSVSEGTSMQCLVTGKPVAEPGLFPMLKKVPGGSSSGISLVSFNSRSFESFGLSGNENAPISREAAERAATALNRLIDPAWPDPVNPDRTLPARSLRVSADTAVCYWSASPSKESMSLLDSLAGLIEGDSEEDVSEVFRSVWRGAPHEIQDDSAFYVLILSGAQGRAIVRDWIESTLQVALQNLARHFDDLKIVRNTHPKQGTDPPPTVPLKWLMDSLSPPGRNESVPAPLETAFLRAAFLGLPYPIQILQRALVRTRAECGNDDWVASMRRDARAALIRAVLNRRPGSSSDPLSQCPEVPVSFDPQVKNPGYSLGALMAVLERLQQIALGDVNATVIDRYFSAASASPRSVFIRLLKNSRHHAKKATESGGDKEGGYARKLDRMIDHFCAQFELDIKRMPYPFPNAGIPAHLGLEQQGLFVLGYHQMRHWLRMPKDARREWEDAHADAPQVFTTSREAVEQAS